MNEPFDRVETLIEELKSMTNNYDVSKSNHKEKIIKEIKDKFLYIEQEIDNSEKSSDEKEILYYIVTDLKSNFKK